MDQTRSLELIILLYDYYGLIPNLL